MELLDQMVILGLVVKGTSVLFCRVSLRLCIVMLSVQKHRGLEAVLKLLSYEPRHIDELMGQGFSAGELNALLTMLELKGQVVAQSGKQYCLKQES